MPRAAAAEGDALAIAIAAEDWERAALLVALGMRMAARLLPEETIDDVLALLSDEQEAPR